MRLIRSSAAFALAALATFAAQAGLVQVSTVNADTTVGWGVLGPEFTAVGSTASVGPATVTGSTFGVLNGSTYNGDFLPADVLLTMFDLNTGDAVDGVFDIQLSSAVQAIGAQVQANAFGPFSVLIEAFGAGDTPLGSFTLGGNNGGNGDGSALFAGVMTDGLEITHVRFSGLGAGAAIGSLLLDTVVDQVPEPGTLLLAGMALAALARRRRNNA